ncbi:hypothetical protein [Pseudonocardia sp. N23]|uniref:hypothetical protein n=1 Tax=Pseudonocardia sp. N23 TaxID=1987376 RepID=UPI000BFC34CB|nr:hypothetical protein [Pseudonocardia sp. N23]RTL63170.1 MAG: hypothetical protein EKK42_29265 [Pseudonocardiaceae bacterium]GAY08592.1 hypothetical protein TOK_2349 [Pseudonocardia sp. N23]
MEWEDRVTDLHIWLMTAAEANAELNPECEIASSHVLVLSSGGGGDLATGGSLEELAALGARISRLCAGAGKERPDGRRSAEEGDDEQVAHDLT